MGRPRAAIVDAAIDCAAMGAWPKKDAWAMTRAVGDGATTPPIEVRTGTGAATSPGTARRFSGIPKLAALLRMTPPGDIAAMCCAGIVAPSRAASPRAPGGNIRGVLFGDGAMPTGAPAPPEAVVVDDPGKKGLPEAHGIARMAAVPLPKRLMVAVGRPPGDM
mmetsp:Transcript_127935/g.370245  ORF Transcript_127935/g.370245 Transcript_127935/m.370245 type:complete len:163 (-) Transcript_127935:278-766(-)